jgi:NDP-sugar pyrophosphorylase family protein
MKAMILAAGEGTRLRPLTDNIPKCMVPVGGKPLIEHTIEWLHKHGICEIMMNLHHRPNVVTEHFGDGHEWGVEITYSIEAELLGTAGGVKNVESYFDGPFFLWYGDNLCTCDLKSMRETHERKGGIASIAIHQRKDPTKSGMVELDENDRITRFIEKPHRDQVTSDWVSAAIFILETRVFDYIPSVGEPDFGHNVIPEMLAAGESLYGNRLSSNEIIFWIDTPEDLRRVQKQFDESNSLEL